MREIVRAKPVNRLTAAVIDFLIAFVASFLLLMIGISVVLPNCPTYVNHFEHLNSYRHNSALYVLGDEDAGDYSIVTMTENRYFSKTPAKYNKYSDYWILNNTAYYYLSYKCYNNNNPQGMIWDIDGFHFDGAPNANEEIVINGEKRTKSSYFTAQWFNEAILRLNEKEGQDLFEYQVIGGEIRKDLIAVPNKNLFIEDSMIVNGETQTTEVITKDNLIKLQSFMKKRYGEAYLDLYSQPFYSKVQNSMNTWFSATTVLCVVIPLLIFYLIIPLCTKNGKTIGKICFKLLTISVDEYKAQWWQIALRPLFAVIFSIIMFFIPNIYWSVLIAVGIVLISLSLLFFLPSKQTIHDLYSMTIVIEGRESKFYKNKEEELVADELEKQKKEKEELTRKRPKINPQYDFTNYNKKGRK